MKELAWWGTAWVSDVSLDIQKPKEKERCEKKRRG